MDPALLPGEIYRHDQFYRNPATRLWQRKYFVVLANTHANDAVARLLTSQPHGRPEDPRCYHGTPYPGFYLGVIGGALTAKSWLDLRPLEDLDPGEIRRRITQGVVTYAAEVDPALMPAMLRCVAAADDTTKSQERAVRDVLASWGS